MRYKLGLWKKNPLFVRSPSHGLCDFQYWRRGCDGRESGDYGRALGANEGVGAKIADARAMLDTSTVMAYVLLVIVFVSLFEYLITKPLEILFMPWRR